MGWFIAIILISLLGLIGLKILHRKKGDRSSVKFLYKLKTLLTENELEFLQRMENAVPELRFHAQVAMGALIMPIVSRYEKGGDFYRLRSQFSQKIVDFVAQNRENGQVIAVIELDDKTHNSEKDAQRDTMLRQAGYKIVRWHSKNKPDTETIRRELLNTLIITKNP